MSDLDTFSKARPVWIAGADPTNPNPAGSAANPNYVISGGSEYETVAASQTDQVLGSGGAIGDYFQGLLAIPATTSPGAISVKDGSGSSITLFAGGASSVSDLRPFGIPFPAKSLNGGWKVTTGANVSVVGFGDFT